MNKLVKYLFRPLLLITLALGLTCFIAPNYMTFIPWSYQGGFVIATIPAAITLMLDGAIGASMASLKLRLTTGE